MSVNEWELRPDGMLVQRKDEISSAHDASPSPSSGCSMLKLHVSFGPQHHQVSIPSQSSFGELKVILAPLVGLHPQDQRLLFSGKEREDADFLHTAGVDGKSRIIVVEDPASKERKYEEMRRNEGITKACQAVGIIREDVDKLAEQVSSLEKAVNGGAKVAEKQFVVLSELLMRDLLKLDGIEAEGEAKVQRKIEVRRVQGLTDKVDSLKVQNSNPHSNNAVVVTTKWESFDSGFGSLSAPPPSASSNVTMNWEVFD